MLGRVNLTLVVSKTIRTVFWSVLEHPSSENTLKKTANEHQPTTSHVYGFGLGAPNSEKKLQRVFVDVLPYCAPIITHTLGGQHILPWRFEVVDRMRKRNFLPKQNTIFIITNKNKSIF